MMNKRSGVVATFAEGDDLKHLSDTGSVATTWTNLDAPTEILLAPGAVRTDALHEWVHYLNVKNGIHTPGDQDIDTWLASHSSLLKIDPSGLGH